MSKRSSPDKPGEDDGKTGSAPSFATTQLPKRRRLVSIEPVSLPAISTVNDLDAKILGFQNRKLSERLYQRKRIENDLRNRIQQLEQRQTQTDTVLCIVNRHWNRLDEDLRILLQRLDVEGSQDASTENSVVDSDSFLTQLSHWDKEELDEQLSGRVEFSRRAVTRILDSLERYGKTKETISSNLKEIFRTSKANGGYNEDATLFLCNRTLWINTQF
ncbi:unnamed protein product [Soboliphyme baturini]|uniref:E3 ubiquitin protein ligase n=1 Tax=Soboliphyme baturini TaxID=241478 RepID=A0A183J428_9BILA|nr:unnamed protein product [Soboliphyme baturini]